MMMAVWPAIVAVFLNIQLKFVTSFQTLTLSRNCIQAATSTFSTNTSTSLYLSPSDIQAKLQEQMAKLQDRDRSSKEISSDVSIHNIDM